MLLDKIFPGKKPFAENGTGLFVYLAQREDRCRTIISISKYRENLINNIPLPFRATTVKIIDAPHYYAFCALLIYNFVTHGKTTSG
jgi:hypothetical protein